MKNVSFRSLEVLSNRSNAFYVENKRPLISSQTRVECPSNRSRTSCASGDTLCPAPLPPRGHPSTSRAAEQTQRSSTFPRQIYVPMLTAAAALRVKAALSKAAWWPWPLTFWPWKWCPSYVWRGPILVFLSFSVLDFDPMYATDRQTYRFRRQTNASLNAPPIRGGA